MLLSGWRLLIGLFIVVASVGGGIVFAPRSVAGAIAIAAGGLIIAVAINVYRPPTRRDTPDDDAMEDAPESRWAELMRGTSKFLIDMRYRYSVRMDENPTGDRSCFTAEVNSVRLGFIPALVTDNTNDRQGYGYVAFVYDNNRWRGPGLPCPDGKTEALKHAARCVSPLASDEETQF